MTKRNWRAYFRRQEETAALLEQPHTDDEQLPRYSEIQNQENAYGTMDQSPSTVEKSKVDQGTNQENVYGTMDQSPSDVEKLKFDQRTDQENVYGTIDQSSSDVEKSKFDQRTDAKKWEVDIIEKWNSETEAEKKKARRLYSGLLCRLNMESNESLEKLLKSDLIEILDIAREEASTPLRPNIAAQLDIARGKSFTTPSIKENMSFEKLSKLGHAELLRVARVTPYHRVPKPVFMKVPNSDLVDLLREARSEDLRKYEVVASRDRMSRHVEKEKSNNVHEAKLQEDDQVCKPEDMFHKLPSQTSKTELELKGLKEMPDKIELESDDWLDKVEGQVETTTTDFVEGGAKTKKGTMDQHTKTEKSGIYTTKESFFAACALQDKNRLNIDLLDQASCETDEYLEKLRKSDLVELVDIARDEVFSPYEPPNLEGLLDMARGESFERFPIPPLELPQCVPLNLVSLFREAQNEHDKRYSETDGEQPTQPKEQEMPREEPDEAKLQKDDQLYKMGKCVGCGNITPESDIDTCSSTGSTNAAESSTLVDNKNEPLRQARIQARRKTETAIEKTRELHHLLVRLETEMEQRNKTFEIQDFDDVKAKAVEVGRDLDDSILRMEEMLALL
ncbi:hypothetical protein VE04_02337 [Pseudogymnoascus sp. 24MN13]|nr:hypothetical protein VE04_02337 [Pseudogymnoascus sp. 24MN13]